MSGKRKSETTISAAQKKTKDSQSIIVHSSGATSTKTMTTPTSVIQNSPQTLLNTTNSPPDTQQPKRIKATPLQPGQPIPPGTTIFTSYLHQEVFCLILTRNIEKNYGLFFSVVRFIL